MHTRKRQAWKSVLATLVIGGGALAIGTVPPAQALQTILNYPTFASTAGMQLNASAAQSGTAIRLTSAGDQVGSAYATTKVSLTDSFSTHFAARLTPLSPCLGDGMTFAIQNAATGASTQPSKALSGGGGLGYQTVTPSIAVELDTFNNGVNDNNSGNHLAIRNNGNGPSTPAADVLPTDPGFTLGDGTTNHVWVDYDAVGHVLRVFASKSPYKPLAPLITYPVDLATQVGATAFAGFTAATGFCAETADVLSWHFTPPTTTVVVSSNNPQPFGQPVTFTATVCGVTTAPTGTVTFFDNPPAATPASLGTAALVPSTALCRVASITSSTLLAGSHTISGVYTGDTVNGDSTGSLAQQIGCTAVNGSAGNVLVPSGQAYCITGTINGNVTVANGGSLFMNGATVSGALNSSGARNIAVCDSSISGSATIANATGFVLVGDGGEDGCDPNSLKNLSLSGNLAGLEVSGNTVSASVTATNNQVAAGSRDETNQPAVIIIEGNSITTSLMCTGNNPPPDNEGTANTAGSKAGQCLSI